MRSIEVDMIAILDSQFDASCSKVAIRVTEADIEDIEGPIQCHSSSLRPTVSAENNEGDNF